MWLFPTLGTLVLVGVLGLLLWMLLFNSMVATRRVVMDTQVLMLPPPPPPPPPPPEKPKQQTAQKEPLPPPEPLKEEPKPPEPEPPKPQAEPVTIDAEAQAGADNFSIQAGNGAGRVGGGPAGAGTASYARYLSYVLQQAISKDEHIHEMEFQLLVDVWIGPDGTVSRVELERSSGNKQADSMVLESLRHFGKLDQLPPETLTFPARVLVQGRRPLG